MRHLVIIVTGLVEGDADHLGLPNEVDELDPLGIATLGTNRIGSSADDHALVRHHQILVGLILYLEDAYDRAVTIIGNDVDEALTSPVDSLSTAQIGVEGCPLAITALGCGEEILILTVYLIAIESDAADDLVTVDESDPAYTGCATTHGPDLVLTEPDGHPIAGGQHDVAVSIGDGDVDQLIALTETDPDDPRRPDVPVRGQTRLLDHTVGGGKEEIVTLSELLDGDDRGQLLVGLDGQNIDDGLAPSRSTPLGQVEDSTTEHPAKGGEEQHGRVGRRDEQILDEVRILGRHPTLPATTAPLHHLSSPCASCATPRARHAPSPHPTPPAPRCGWLP